MAYDLNNIFAKMLHGELECNKVYEDNQVLAFHDKFPKAKIHILVIPKIKAISFDDFIEMSSSEQIAHFFKIVKNIAHEFDLKESGYRLITNHGEDANQVVKHFHVHILGKTALK